MITFCFLVSVIFKNPSIANSVDSVAFLAAIAPYMIYHEDFYKFGYGLKALFCMLTNTNMGLGIKMILLAEKSENGIAFENFFTRPAELDFSFAELLIFMNIGSALMMQLVFYIVFNDRDEIPSRSSSRNAHFEKYDQEDEPENFKARIEIKRVRGSKGLMLSRICH